MRASQDAWAGPLAKRLVSRFRTQALTYIRVEQGRYDEETGVIPIVETAISAAGAVAKSKKGERDGTEQSHYIEVWIDHDTVKWPISTADSLKYLGRKWKITKITSYGSGGDPAGQLVYLSTLDGKIVTTLDGKAIVMQGEPEDENFEYSMYASHIIARAE